MSRRVRFFHRGWVLLVLAVLLVLTAGEASARKWVFADARGWNLLRACRDGVMVSVLYDADSTLEVDPFAPIYLAVYKHTNPSLNPPSQQGNLSGSEPSAYGPQILPYTPVAMSVQDAPLVVSTGDAGPKSYPIHTFAELRWDTPLEPGESIIVIQDNNNESNRNLGSAAPIQDCTLGQSHFSAGDNLALGAAQLPSPAPEIPTDQLVYQLGWAPSKGDLFNEETLLNQLDSFTQDDIESGRLTYRSEGGSQYDLLAARAYQAGWVSQPVSGEDPYSGSYEPNISTDGRYIAFANPSSNMDPDHPGNGYEQIYLRDRDADENGIYGEPEGESLSLVTLGLDGNPGNENSNNPHISAYERYIAFQSFASNLVEGDDEGYYDIFVAGEGKIVRVSVASDGTPGAGDSFDPVISGDGRFVVFSSVAKNFGNISADDVYIIYVHDRDVDEDGVYDEPGQIQTEAIDTDADQDAWGPSISADGRYVVFSSSATNLLPNDNKERVDVFLYDLTTGELGLVSGYDENGDEWLPDGDSWVVSKQSISADGRYVVFGSTANYDDYDGNGFEDVYLFDRLTHRNRLVSFEYRGLSGAAASHSPSISADGRFVAFRSLAPYLVEGDTEENYDVFVFDRLNGEIVRMTENAGGPATGEEGGDYPALSGDGRFVVFDTLSSDLIPGKTTQCTFNEESFPCNNIVVSYVGFPFIFPLEIQQAVFLPLLR